MSTTATAPPRRPPPAANPSPPRLTISPETALAGSASARVAVLGLWWQDTEFVYGLGSWLTNAGRITGLLCGYAVVVLLALMARVPAWSTASAPTGWPAGTRWAGATPSASPSPTRC